MSDPREIPESIDVYLGSLRDLVNDEFSEGMSKAIRSALSMAHAYGKREATNLFCCELNAVIDKMKKIYGDG